MTTPLPSIGTVSAQTPEYLPPSGKCEHDGQRYAGLIERKVDCPICMTAALRGWEEGRLKGEKQQAGTLLYLRQEHERLKKSVEAFHKKSGIRIDSYDGGQTGTLVKALFEKDHGGLQDALRRMEQNLKEALGQVMSAKEELKTVRKGDASGKNP